MSLVFEWSEDKARANLRKHKVSFDEAQTVFLACREPFLTLGIRRASRGSESSACRA